MPEIPQTDGPHPSGDVTPAATSRRRPRTSPATPPIPPAAHDVILVGIGDATHEAFVPALLALQEAGALAVRAVVEPAEPRRALLQKSFPTARASASLDSVVMPPGALAIVASPPRFHVAQATAALKRGWHVLCDLPLAPTPREAATLIATAQRNERLLAAHLQHRAFPACRYLRTVCRDQLLGPLLTFCIQVHDTSGGDERPIELFERPDRRESVLTALGLPVIDLLVWGLGAPAVLSYADDAMGGVAANAFIELAFSEGARGTIQLSRDWPTAQFHRFVFERGTLTWRAGEANRLTLQLASTPAALDAMLVQPMPPEGRPRWAPLPARGQCAVAQLEHLLAAIAGREPLRIPASDALPAMSVLEDCLERRTFLEQPWFNANEAVQARTLSPRPEPRRP